MTFKKMLTSNNIERIVKEISHKEIVQKSMFVIDSFKLHLHGLMSEAVLFECYKNLIPNNCRESVFPRNFAIKRSRNEEISSKIQTRARQRGSGKILEILHRIRFDVERNKGPDYKP